MTLRRWKAALMCPCQRHTDLRDLLINLGLVAALAFLVAIALVAEALKG